MLRDRREVIRFSLQQKIHIFPILSSFQAAAFRRKMSISSRSQVNADRSFKMTTLIHIWWRGESNRQRCRCHYENCSWSLSLVMCVIALPGKKGEGKLKYYRSFTFPQVFLEPNSEARLIKEFQIGRNWVWAWVWVWVWLTKNIPFQ